MAVPYCAAPPDSASAAPSLMSAAWAVRERLRTGQDGRGHESQADGRLLHRGLQGIAVDMSGGDSSVARAFADRSCPGGARVGATAKDIRGGTGYAAGKPRDRVARTDGEFAHVRYLAQTDGHGLPRRATQECITDVPTSSRRPACSRPGGARPWNRKALRLNANQHDLNGHARRAGVHARRVSTFDRSLHDRRSASPTRTLDGDHAARVRVRSKATHFIATLHSSAADESGFRLISRPTRCRPSSTLSAVSSPLSKCMSPAAAGGRRYRRDPAGIAIPMAMHYVGMSAFRRRRAKCGPSNGTADQHLLSSSADGFIGRGLSSVPVARAQMDRAVLRARSEPLRRECSAMSVAYDPSIALATSSRAR